MNYFRNIFLVFILSAGLSSAAKAQAKFGRPAMEIALPSANGDTLKLSSLKGKVVLLDFWASWCIPCRYANKRLVKLYARYREKGFEIFGVSLDENSNAWMRAVKKDKITWTQVIDSRGQDAKTAVDWNVYQLPTNYLIGRDGKLVAMDLEPEQLEALLKDLL